MKERRLERSTLKEISFDLMKDTTRIANDIARMENSRNIIRSVITNIDARKPLKVHFQMRSWRPTRRTRLDW